MSAAETLYSARVPYPDCIERGRAQTVALEVYRDGALVAPTEAGSTLTIFSPGGTKLVDAAPVTVVGSVATYAIPALTLADTIALGEGYLQEWSLVMPDGTTRVYRRTMAVSRRALFPVITDDDLTAEYPDLLTQIAGLSSTLQPFIDESWKRIIRSSIRKGVLTYTVMDADSFADWHRELAHFLIFKALFRATNNDRFRELFTWHNTRSEAEASRLNFSEDADHDGVADSSSRKSLAAVVHVNAAPRSRLARDPRW